MFEQILMKYLIKQQWTHLKNLDEDWHRQIQATIELVAVD